MDKKFFTSESVTEGHPDKMCDAISDAILDALMEKDPMSRVACETCVTTGLVMVMGEITTKAYVDIPKVVRDTIREIGYTRGKYGFDADTCGVIKLIEIIRDNFDLRPAGIIKMLDLRRPIYKQTAAYGHFGRNDLNLPWERLDKVKEMKKYLELYQ